VPEEVGEATAHPLVDILPSLVHNRFVRESFRGNVMEPRIQYAKTTDGLSIAFWTLGEGMPVVHMPALPWSHIQLEWRIPDQRCWYERLAEKWKLLRYDNRGSGLSDREVTDLSLDAHLLDLEAVVDRLGLGRFALLAPHASGLVAVAYAARHRERVSHLILWCPFARLSDALAVTQSRALEALADVDWTVATETMARVMFGGLDEMAVRATAAFFREAVALETLRAGIEAFREVDLHPLLPLVRSPTLVLARRQLPHGQSVRWARDLASRIPDACLRLLEGTSGSLSEGDTEAVLTAIDEFLGEGKEAATQAEPPAAGVFRTVLFTDVAGSTSMMQRLGDEEGRAVLREHERITRQALKAHGGTEVKTMGDGFMASFSSATKALECAIAMQRTFAEHNESAEEPIRVRIGLNAGEPIAEEADLFGAAVILAARIAAKAEGGEIMVSDTVRGLVAGKGFLFSDRGDVVLRGFEDPVRLYEVRWQE
jgi:class 3 adenylate cyclase